MKYYSSILLTSLGVFLSIGFISFAQSAPILTPTNHSTNLNESFTYYIADSNAVNYDLVTGANVTWDYSNLQGYNSTVNQDIVLPMTTNQGNNFTNSALADNLNDELIIYKNNNSTSIEAQGYVLDLPGLGEVRIELSDESTLMTYPFNFNDAYTDSLAGNAFVQISPFPVPYSGNISVIADGHGTLILGTHTYNSVLRVKIVESSVADASSFNFGMITIDRIQYFYYDPTISKFPLFMHVTLDVNGTASSVAYSKDMLPGFTNIDEQVSLSDINLFPNPAESQVVLSYNSSKAGLLKLNILSSLGQEVLSTSFKANLGVNKQVLSLDQLESGIYFVNLQIGSRNITQKLILH